MSFDVSKLSILIVDDQSLVRTLISQTLQTMGFKLDQIYQAADGTTGMRTLDLRMMNLVLCDVEMQPMNGLDLLKMVRCGHTNNPSNIPFLFLSGHADRSNVVTAVKLHADGFIVKPPKPADVEKAIHSALTRPRPEIDPFSYYHVSTGTEFDKKVFATLFETAQEEEKDTNEGPPLALKQIRPGAILAKDLYSHTGHLLLPRGSSITANQLSVLKEFSNRYGVSVIHIEQDEDEQAAEHASQPTNMNNAHNNVG